MSRSGLFGVLNPNLEEFLDHNPLGVYTGRGGGGEEEKEFLFLNQYHYVRCLEVGILGR